MPETACVPRAGLWSVDKAGIDALLDGAATTPIPASPHGRSACLGYPW